MNIIFDFPKIKKISKSKEFIDKTDLYHLKLELAKKLGYKNVAEALLDYGKNDFNIAFDEYFKPQK